VAATAPAGTARLDWAKAFDLDGDGAKDVLNPGALLATPAALSIDFASSMEMVLAGTVSGTGTYDNGTPGNTADDLANVLLSIDPSYIAGTAAFALERRTLDVDTDGNGTADLLKATVQTVALSVTNATVQVAGVAKVKVSGTLGLASVTAAGSVTGARYSAMKMGDVSVEVVGGVAGLSLTGTFTVSRLDTNAVAATAPAGTARLDWAKAFDLDGDGAKDVLNPGALLATPAALSIDFASSMEMVLAGTVSGTGTYDNGTPGNTADDLANVLLAIDPIYIAGTAAFALERRTLDVDTDGNGTADLLKATVQTVALSVTNATVQVAGVAKVKVSGTLGLASVTAAGSVTGARYSAMKMGDVSVEVVGGVAGLSLTGTFTVSRLDTNGVAATAPAGTARLDWAKAFDLDGDGAKDVLNPGALLATPAALSIDFASSMEMV